MVIDTLKNIDKQPVTVLNTDKVGAVLVIGAGISGMQASLDLADSGFYVYLLDKEQAIGGLMSKLDKTFPTNDCAMCVMSPKLVDCGRHLNIEIITYAQVKGIVGEPGNYKVKIVRKAKSVDESLCTGCGECVANCPSRFIIHPAGLGPHYIPQVADQDREYLDDLIKREPDVEGNLLGVLQNINSKFRYLPEPVLKYFSDQTRIPLARLISIATFYNAFSLKPRGEYLVRVCLGTACYLKGGGKIVDAISKEFNVDHGETTADGLFTLERVNCVGACALAPVVTVNDKYHGKMNPSKMLKVLEEIREGSRKAAD